MIEKYPNALLIKDRWGDIPLTYALFAEASMEETNQLCFQVAQENVGEYIL